MKKVFRMLAMASAVALLAFIAVSVPAAASGLEKPAQMSGMTDPLFQEPPIRSPVGIAAGQLKSDTDFCDACFDALYCCVCDCGGHTDFCPWQAGPGDQACKDQCQATFRECRRNCII